MAEAKLRVLHVEDDKIDQLAFKRFVRDKNLPYDLTVAGSVAEAKQVLGAARFDAIVTDYSLGDGNAFDLLDLFRGMPVIFTTGQGDEIVAVRAMKTGAADYLIKDHERSYLRVLPVTIENAVRRMKAEEQVRKLQRAVEQSPATVVITDTRGVIEYVNPKFTRLTGYALEEVVGKNPRVLKSGEQDAAFYQNLWGTIAAGNEWRGEFHNRHKNGTLFWEFASISPIRDADGVVTHYVAVKEDITERKRIEEERERLIQELDAFAHTVAHDLKSPLGAVLGFADLLSKDRAGMNPAELQECLDAIAESARKMHGIIEELLLLAGVRKAEVPTRPIDMKHVVAGAWSRLTVLVKEHDPEFIVPETWAPSAGHGPWIEEVGANYLSNALKYGGRPPRVVLGSEQLCDGRSRFWVDDNGPGLTAEQRERLFTPFTRLHQVRATGQGLGLSIVRRIMEKLCGEAWVESEPGKGSRFGFTLPSVPKPDGTECPAA